MLKKFKKNWKIHAYYGIAIAMIVACIAMIWSIKEIKSLRMALKDSEQTLTECQHSFSIWESQIESGSIKILKRDGNTEIIERWEMVRE